MQIVLDEEQAIWYLVKYASKPEKRCKSINQLIRSLIPSRPQHGEESKVEQESKAEQEQAVNSRTVSGTKLI